MRATHTLGLYREDWGFIDLFSLFFSKTKEEAS